MGAPYHDRHRRCAAFSLRNVVVFVCLRVCVSAHNALHCAESSLSRQPHTFLPLITLALARLACALETHTLKYTQVK